MDQKHIQIVDCHKGRGLVIEFDDSGMVLTVNLSNILNMVDWLKRNGYGDSGDYLLRKWQDLGGKNDGVSVLHHDPFIAGAALECNTPF